MSTYEPRGGARELLLAREPVVLMSGAASALPGGRMDTAGVARAETVRWMCNEYGRCWWRPGFSRSYGYYEPPRRHREWRHRGWDDRRWGYRGDGPRYYREW